MDAFSNTHPNFVEETLNLHVDVDSKEIELFIFASIETLKSQNKCGKDKVFALVKDSLEEIIAMKSFEKISELLQGSHSRKCNINFNGTRLSIPKEISLPKVRSQNTSSIKIDFEDSKNHSEC